ncbi:MAG: DUF1579 domain-containing protein [Chloroflexi bacterium]|nr:DUF1579 domain-containing protein [Chloroflexota bacterium]
MDTSSTQREPAMKTQVLKEHRWLQKFVGEWTFEGEMTMDPSKPPEKFKGTESVRSLDGLWIVAEGQSEMPGGGAATMLTTLGYDPQKKRYVGTFIMSMETHLWLYDGALDATERVLTLETEGPNMTAEGTMAKFKDVTEFKTDDHRALTSHMLGDDGRWHSFMTINFRRKK